MVPGFEPVLVRSSTGPVLKPSYGVPYVLLFVRHKTKAIVSRITKWINRSTVITFWLEWRVSVNKIEHVELSYSASQVQCDQIWRNFGTLTKKLKVLGNFLRVYLNFDSTLAKLLWYWASFHCCSWANIFKWFSHLVTLLRSLTEWTFEKNQFFNEMERHNSSKIVLKVFASHSLRRLLTVVSS